MLTKPPVDDVEEQGDPEDDRLERAIDRLAELISRIPPPPPTHASAGRKGGRVKGVKGFAVDGTRTEEGKKGRASRAGRKGWRVRKKKEGGVQRDEKGRFGKREEGPDGQGNV